MRVRVTAVGSDGVQVSQEAAPVVASLARIRLVLVPLSTDDGVALYHRKLGVAEVQARIQNCWQPYHAAVEQAIDAGDHVILLGRLESGVAVKGAPLVYAHREFGTHSSFVVTKVES